PVKYANFLGLELQFVYSGPVLVVMPAGFGFFDGGRPTTVATRALTNATVDDTSPDGLSTAAAKAIVLLDRSGALAYADHRAPGSYPRPPSGRAGGSVALPYQVWDDSGRAAVALRVTQGARLVASFAVPVRTVDQSTVYSVRWHAPRSLAGQPLTFCTRATDGSGNRGKLSCRRFILRRAASGRAGDRPRAASRRRARAPA